ncbi:MAG: M23 family metallopeptidase [Anaerolineales bacterium]|nr:M23 family metallopeptidase [Anaerolineales bacterium]
MKNKLSKRVLRVCLIFVGISLLWKIITWGDSNRVWGQEPVVTPAPTSQMATMPSSDTGLIWQAAQEAIANTDNPSFTIFQPRIEQIQQADDWAIVTIVPQRNWESSMKPMYLIAHNDKQHWQLAFWGDSNWQSWSKQIPKVLLTPGVKSSLSSNTNQSISIMSTFSGYKLPWACNQIRELTRSISHGGDLYYAFDFGYNGATFKIHAAKGGTVDSWQDTCAAGNSSCNNFLNIKHDDTSPISYSAYYHLAQGSIPNQLKQYGKAVQQGDTLGWAGNTGPATGVHLHFNAYTSPNWWIAQDVIFNDVDSDGGRPRRWDEGGHHYLNGQPSNWFRSGNCSGSTPLDYNGDGKPDLYGINKIGTGAGHKTEVHIMNGANDYKSYLLNAETILGDTGTNCRWDFATGAAICPKPSNKQLYLPLIIR